MEYLDDSSLHYPEPSPEPIELPKIVGDYKILREFNLGDYVVWDRKYGTYFTLLPPVTDSREDKLEDGKCVLHAFNNVHHNLRIIREGTSDLHDSNYFGYFFKDVPSLDNLLDSCNTNELLRVLDFLETVGVTSEDHYQMRALFRMQTEKKDLESEVTKERDLESEHFEGCIRYKIHDSDTFMGAGLHLSVESVERLDDDYVYEDEDDFEDDVDLCSNHLRRFGSVVGLMRVPEDNELMYHNHIYDSSKPTKFLNGKLNGHAVMIIGFGLAIHLPTNRKFTYYVFQDNQGLENGPICRVPCTMFAVAFAPKLWGQKDLVSFAQSDTKYRRMTLIRATSKMRSDLEASGEIPVHEDNVESEDASKIRSDLEASGEIPVHEDNVESEDEVNPEAEDQANTTSTSSSSPSSDQGREEDFPPRKKQRT